MKYVVLSNRTEPIIRAKYFSELRLFLSILEYDYPFFTSWLDKVFLELNSPKRKIILCLSNDDIHIYGVAILKDTQDEKKICTIRVERAYQNLGIGTVLVKMAQEILNCESKEEALIKECKKNKGSLNDFPFYFSIKGINASI